MWAPLREDLCLSHLLLWIQPLATWCSFTNGDKLIGIFIQQSVICLLLPDTEKKLVLFFVNLICYPTNILFMYRYFPCMYICAPCAFLVPEEVEEGSISLELEL